MMGPLTRLLLLAAVTVAAPPQEPALHIADTQHPLSFNVLKTQPAPRKLQGRFLHITGIVSFPVQENLSLIDHRCPPGPLLQSPL